MSQKSGSSEHVLTTPRHTRHSGATPSGGLDDSFWRKSKDEPKVKCDSNTAPEDKVNPIESIVKPIESLGAVVQAKKKAKQVMPPPPRPPVPSSLL
mgnify:FL=1|tara:strand:- start:314 stop:601 length:288 start_codon:yes stop_codon:yes gene_type:complete